jgi:hypothetical protein
MKYKIGDRFKPKNPGQAEKTVVNILEFFGCYVLQADGIKNPSSLTEEYLDKNYERMII